MTLPVLASSVRATTSTLSASSTPEIQIFWPFRTHSSPSLRAVVVMLWVLVPASGSVIAKAIVLVPSHRPGSHFCFCASVPYLVITVPQIAGLTTISSIGQPCAESSSQTAAMSPMPPRRRRTPRAC